MQFYTKTHHHYCGIDLHARTMCVCIMNQGGDILVYRNIRTNQDRFLQLIAPYRDDLVVCVECMFTWYWLADMRATRDLLRRRMHLSRQRAHLIAHIQNTVHQYNLPAIGVRLGKPSERGGVVAPFPDGDTQGAGHPGEKSGADGVCHAQ